MKPATIVAITDVAGSPRVKLDLPDLRIGDRVTLNFRLQRKSGGRSEVLNVAGVFRVSTVDLDTSESPPRQILSVEATGKAPSWQAVKNSATSPRPMAPARFPRTSIP